MKTAEGKVTWINQSSGIRRLISIFIVHVCKTDGNYYFINSYQYQINSLSPLLLMYNGQNVAYRPLGHHAILPFEPTIQHVVVV